MQHDTNHTAPHGAHDLHTCDTCGTAPGRFYVSVDGGAAYGFGGYLCAPCASRVDPDDAVAPGCAACGDTVVACTCGCAACRKAKAATPTHCATGSLCLGDGSATAAQPTCAACTAYAATGQPWPLPGHDTPDPDDTPVHGLYDGSGKDRRL
jgi:hypothetical protein